MANYQVIWKGPVDRASGLGLASREYALALARQGVDIKIETTSKRSPMILKNPTLAFLIRKPYARNKRKILIYHHSPNTINMTKARKRFHYMILNIVWETTKIPKQWMSNINKFDAICVPSWQNRRALLSSGVKVPIFIVPHGVQWNAFVPWNKKLSVRGTYGKFNFVSVFGFQHRKNPETLLRAFWEEFSQKDKVALVIRTKGYQSYETVNWIRQKILNYRKKLKVKPNRAPVIVLPKYMSTGQLKGLYRLGNAFVLPTRGEGVCLPFLEALSSGVPVIATAWGGHMDFLKARNSFLVKYQLRNPAISMNSKHAIARPFRYLFAQKGQLWAEPDIKSLKREMRKAYNSPALCRIKGAQGRRDVQRFNWNRAGILFKHVIYKVIKGSK
ncbi:glycosyltransferase family 4 protein [Brevibacillus sp. SYSU BS000544]|uniref:glycosyltransferase family 4 protein n=1 Tax=Brevibacillus sp. SYSU BS000544 TaxID=3416443 RepID=UPI003CE5297C